MYHPFEKTARLLSAGTYTMRIPKQFLGGVLVGLALGIMLGAYLVEGKKEVNYTSIAGVGMLLAIAGVSMARAGSPKNIAGDTPPRSRLEDADGSGSSFER